MSDTPPNIKAIFDRAVEIESVSMRASFVADACVGYPEVQQKVEALLQAYVDAGSFLEPPPPVSPHAETPTVSPEEDALAGYLATASFNENSEALPSDSASEEETEGTVIAGKYTLMEPVGLGGMGTVWRAKQTEPVKRFVAIKMIKAGMDSKQVIARFEAERQALALMDHPNIAKVFDGGIHNRRPFFVMELVKGTPITEYCDRCQLAPKERLELFIQVCQAIQHAHQKGIIHRDIKPSNVLIALYDDKQVVKVIDFGVAKATGGALTDKTLDTYFGGVIGTPLYMSPEQATFNNLDIDTRSDVYALGVLLYELLTGSPPFGRKELDERGFLEILRVLREEEPPRPSFKLSTADALPSLSVNRSMDPKALTGLLQNELDWIVMKALEKDRSRRYESANNFAADVQRYLRGEEVQAHPPSTTYRVKKFVRRHKVQVMASSLVFFALLAGMMGTTLALFEAKRQERLANNAAEEERQAKLRQAESAEGERQAKLEAEKNLQRTKKASQMLRSVFAELDPKNSYATIAELNEALLSKFNIAMKDLEASNVGDPLTIAELQDTLGVALKGLGDTKQAIVFFEKARTTRLAELGPDHTDTLLTTHNLAEAYLNTQDFAKAKSLLEDTFSRRKAQLGSKHTDTLESMSNLGVWYASNSELAKALELCEFVFEARQSVLPSNHLKTLESMNNVGMIQSMQGEYDKALPFLDKAVELAMAKLGPDHPSTLAFTRGLSTIYHEMGDYPKSIEISTEALERTKNKLGANHPSTLLCMSNLAIVYKKAGQFEKAKALMETTLELRKEKLGVKNSSTLDNMCVLGHWYVTSGNQQGLALLEEAFQLSQDVLGPNHHVTLTAMNNLASGYHHHGKIDQALLLYEDLFEIRKKKGGLSHPETLTVMNNMAAAYNDIKDVEKALAIWEESFTLTKAKLGPDHPKTLTSMNNLAFGYSNNGQIDKAIQLNEEAFQLTKAKLGPDHPDTILSMSNLAIGYFRVGQQEQGIALLEKAVELTKANLPPENPYFAFYINQLASTYQKVGDQEKLTKLRQETCQLFKEKLGPTHRSTLLALLDLTILYRNNNDWDNAIKVYEELIPACKVNFGPESKATVTLMAKYGLLCCEAGQQEKAAAVFKQIFELARESESIQSKSGEFAGIFIEYSRKLLTMKQFLLAEAFLRENFAFHEKNMPGSWGMFETQAMLGEALLRLKKYDEAKPMLLKGYEGMKGCDNTSTTDSENSLSRTVDHLMELSTATKQPDQFQKWQAERTKYPVEVAPSPREKQ